MNFLHTFVKEDSGRWYIDLPDFPGDKAELQMVCGADTLLEIISQGSNKVDVHFSDIPFSEATILVKLRDGEDEGGAYYQFRGINGIDYNFEVWLCDVTKYVFGCEILPDYIYFK